MGTVGRNVCFEVPGVAVPWSRPGARAVVGRPKYPGGKPPAFIQWYTDKDVDAYERRVIAMFAHATRLEPFEAVPLGVQVTVYENRLQRLYRRADHPADLPSTSRIDVDNYAKAILDGLQRCAACQSSRKGPARCKCPTPLPLIADDRLVAELIARKRWCAIVDRKQRQCAPPHVEVHVYTLS